MRPTHEHFPHSLHVLSLSFHLHEPCACHLHRTSIPSHLLSAVHPLVASPHTSSTIILLSSQVLAVVHASTVSSSDHYSQRVAITTLASVVPAWLAAGKELSALWSVLVAALPSLPPHRRFSLLNALLSATPEEDSLPVGLLLLIKAATASLLAAPPKPKGKDQARGDEQQPQEQEHEWMLELAAQLCLQVDDHDLMAGRWDTHCWCCGWQVAVCSIAIPATLWGC